MKRKAVTRYRCLRVVAVALPLAFVIPSPPVAQAAEKAEKGEKGEIIERIVAVVNGEALLLSELRKRAAPFLQRVLQAPEMQRMSLMTQLYEELLTQLIDERLLEQESRKLTVSVTSADVDRAVDNLRRQSGIDDKAFWEAVQGQGFSPEQYKSDVRRHLLRLKVVNQKVRSRINLTEEDVRRKYDQMMRSARASSRFNVAHIMLPVEEGSATNLAEVKGRADTLRTKLTPATFDQTMNEYGGGELGWLDQKDIPESFANALLELEPGQISPPVRGPAGVHIFLLRERQEGESTIEPYDKLKNDIYREMVDQAMAKQEGAYLQELRKQSLISRRL